MTIAGRGLLAAGLAFIAASPAAAADFDIRAADNAVWAAVGGYHMGYSERFQDQTLDTETGWMPSWAAGASILTIDDGKAPLRNLYARIDGSLATGTTAYNGQYQNGTPVTSTTDDTVWTVSGRLGRAFAAAPAVMLTPYGELGYRSWNRNLTGTGGYDETYHNSDFIGGLMAQYSPVAKVVLTGDAGFGYTFWARMHSTSPSTDYSLGGRPTWHVGGQAGYTFTQRWEAITSVNYSEMGYGISSAVPTALGTYLEPDSHTAETTLRVGLAWHFF